MAIMERDEVEVAPFTRAKETVRVFPRAARVPAHSADSGGDVSSQWARICSAAAAEVTLRLADQPHDALTVRLIFSPDPASARNAVQSLSHPDTIAAVIHTVYKVLYLDWSGGHVLHLGVIVHSVQRFLVVVVEVAAVELDREDRFRFVRSFRDLLRASEVSGYRSVHQCLDRTRRAYVELWVALLCSPFSGEPESPTISMVERAKTIREEEEEGECA